MNGNNIYSLHKDKTIQVEARAWVLKFNGDNEPTVIDIESLKQWTKQSPAHREALEHAQRFWEDADQLSVLAVPTGKRKSKPLTVKIWSKLTATLDPAPGVYAFTILIAGIVLTASISLFLQPSRLGNGSYSTAVGEQITLTLTDNSLIQLDTQSSIRVDYNNKKREIHLLKGKAHFKVAKNPARPFEVYVQNGVIRAVGTAFSVDLTHYSTKVIVNEGQVDLARIEQQPISSDTVNNSSQSLNPTTPSTNQATLPNKNSLVVFTSLNAGQTASFDDKTEEIKELAAPELSKELAWRKGILVFAGEPLYTVIAEVTRYTDIKITISDPALNQLVVGGRFKVGELEALLDVLEMGFGVHINRVNASHIELNSTSS